MGIKEPTKLKDDHFCRSDEIFARTKIASVSRAHKAQNCMGIKLEKQILNAGLSHKVSTKLYAFHQKPVCDTTA